VDSCFLLTEDEGLHSHKLVSTFVQVIWNSWVYCTNTGKRSKRPGLERTSLVHPSSVTVSSSILQTLHQLYGH